MSASLQHPYTPTDEEVAGRYVDARYQYSDTRKAETRAEFDRFLARVRRGAKAEALREAADDPALRLSGHSGISITRLRARATEYETGEPA